MTTGGTYSDHRAVHIVTTGGTYSDHRAVHIVTTGGTYSDHRAVHIVTTGNLRIKFLYHTLSVPTAQHELYYTGISDCPNTDRQTAITYCTGELRFLGCYAAIGGNSLPTFRDNVSVPSSRVKMGPIGCPETSVRIYHNLLSDCPKSAVLVYVLRGGSLQ